MGEAVHRTAAVALYESEIILLIVEALNGDGPHPLRERGMEAADILDECDFPDEVKDALKTAARNIIQYFAKAVYEAGVSPDDHAHQVQEGIA